MFVIMTKNKKERNEFDAEKYYEHCFFDFLVEMLIVTYNFVPETGRKMKCFF